MKGRVRMNYEVVIVNQKEYHVLETRTNQVVGKFGDLYEARNCAKRFNLGGAFDGWTPNFFIK